MVWEEGNEKFLSLIAWVGSMIYTLPGIVLWVVLVIFDVPTAYWVPVLLLYAVGALSHQLAWGFQAINTQIKVSIDYALGVFEAQREANNLD